ncbi:hypothetical protein G3I40_14745 [Streptomyces sp. SID14478]|uniref:hypothetical protein n=1 Tax=Streptomyces sp. SID14478 TaxID=2706073 RepID=UPI0013DB87B6|nr:hypothetical protein [Streptomyces sp. SID14478]NEB76473.1 hypothetical protein [Streptomyces sp. SID14478]
MGLFDKLTGTRRPGSGVAPVPAGEVRAALLALNADDVPYVIQHGDGDGADLVAQWRIAEPAWQTFFSRTQVTHAVRIRMRLDQENREVRAIEEQWELEWVGNPARRQMSIEYARGPDRTVTRRWTIERGASGRLQATEDFRFDASDLRRPLRDAALGAGWGWRGLLFGKL